MVVGLLIGKEVEAGLLSEMFEGRTNDEGLRG